MTADGMKCQPCSVTTAAAFNELTAPAGAMPGKLIAVVVLLGLGIALNLITMSLLSVALGVALLVGILVGNDGVRRFVMILAWISLVMGGFALVLFVTAGSSLGVIFAAFGVAQNVFLIWALKQDDVRNWMFKTAFKDGL